MRKSLILAAGLLTMLVATQAMSQNISLPRAASPKAKAMQQVGITDITITYSRPSVRERDIWGGLVHYDMINLGLGTAKESPWRAGANENTIITLSHDVQVEGKPLSAGTYGFFVAVKENGRATLIFSHNHNSWGSYFYNPAEDALRVDVETTTISHTESLTYSFPEVGSDYAIVALDWEKKRIPFRISMDVNEIVYTNGMEEMRGVKAFSWQGPHSLAQFALQNNFHLEEGAQMAQQAVGQQSNFQTLSLLGQYQIRQGKTEEGEANIKLAMEQGNPFQLHRLGRQELAQGNTDIAKKIFEFNAKKHPDTWPVNVGLARVYSAEGNFKKALRHLRKALENAPNEPNRQAITSSIEKLERGEDIN